MTGILDTLSGAFEDAKVEEEKRIKDAAKAAFRKAYTKARNAESVPAWPMGNDGSGRIYFADNGGSTYAYATWQTVIELAENKKRGAILEIKADPGDFGRIAGTVSRALDAAFGPDSRYSDSAKKSFVLEAVSAMYLLGLTENRTLLRKIEKYVGAPEDYQTRNYEMRSVMADLFSYFGMVDEYHKDLFPEPPSIKEAGKWADNSRRKQSLLLSVLEETLRPSRLEGEEAFEKGRQEALSDPGNEAWSDGVYAAKATYKMGDTGETRVVRIGWNRAPEIAGLVSSNAVADFRIVSERDKGKLYGSVEKTIQRITGDERRLDDETQNLFVRQAIAGLYLLNRLDAPETVETMKGVLQNRPGLANTIEEELQKYVGAA